MGGGIDGEGELLMCMSLLPLLFNMKRMLIYRLDDQPQADLLAMLLRVRPRSCSMRRN
jgi:hypothetical protein